MAEVSELYNEYPITVTSDDFSTYLGLDLEAEIEGDSENKVTIFLDTVHRQIYDFLIYTVGDKKIKERLISLYASQLENPLKRALLVQGQYLLQNDNIELFNGVIKSANGLEYKEFGETAVRVISPTVINILSATKPNVLYAGG